MKKFRLKSGLYITFSLVILVFMYNGIVQWENIHAALARLKEKSATDLDNVKETMDALKTELKAELKMELKTMKNGMISSNEDTQKGTVKALKHELEKKLSLPAVKVREGPNMCNRTDTRSNSCSGNCHRLSIDQDLATRIDQLTSPSHLQMTAHYHNVLEEMAGWVKGQYDVIVATAASDNHYLESQALIKNLNENMFPFLKNFTFIYYNLGLNASNRAQLVKYCKCQVIDFPFSKFPNFFQKIISYTWKPVIIKSLIKRTNVLIYTDASIRFEKDAQKLHKLLDETRRRGIQYRMSVLSDFAPRSLLSTFHFFAEEPCAYVGRGEISAGFGFYARSYMVERLILEPWVACALDQRCMSPMPHPNYDCSSSIEMMKKWQQGKGPIIYGMCHRFDQSPLNIIVMKTYKERLLDLLMQDRDFVTVKRGDSLRYFPSL